MKLIKTLRDAYVLLAIPVAFQVVSASGAYAATEPSTIQRTSAHVQQGSADFKVETVSSRNDLISGGDVLLRVEIAAAIPLKDVVVTLNGHAVTAELHDETPGGHALLGLVKGLVNGTNTLEVAQSGGSGARTTLELTNHPITGPLLSGAHLTPFACRTEENGLGPALDSDCSARSRVDYFYRTTGGSFAPLANPTGARPADLVTTTTTDGNTVPYIVRVESGVNNRMVYRIAILDDDSKNSTEFKPGPGWNGKLFFSYGPGCGLNYSQGVVSMMVAGPGGPGAPPAGSAVPPGVTALNDLPLSHGFAYAVSTGLLNSQFCSPYIAGETTMMLKEHFIKTYGPVKWTISDGGSGGSTLQFLVAELFPGLLDGIQPSASFSDVASIGYFDCRLLTRVFQQNPGRWSPEKQAAVEGYSPGACPSWDPVLGNLIVADAGYGQSSDGAACDIKDPSQIYDRVANPKGIRCSVQEAWANLLGRDRKTGFAYRVLDNVGVQYGLAAMNSGTITPADFLFINSHVGGYDMDGNVITERSEANPDALVRAYAGGLINSFGGSGLGTMPIIDSRPYVDNGPAFAALHDRQEDFIIRSRLERANGRSDNMLILTTSFGTSSHLRADALSLDFMNRWLDGIAADPAPLTSDKVLRHKPAEATDTCWDPAGNKFVEKATVDGKGRCNALYPLHSSTRRVAGSPVTDDVIKCQLKPVDFGDYKVALTSDEKARLQRIFPNGVCDYSKPGVGQAPLYGSYLRLGSALN
jgi:hypothetical protein